MKDEYIAYEYLSVNVTSDLEPMYIDTYENFGWQLANKGKQDYYINSDVNQRTINIKFKRDRKIANKEKLNELQKQCEETFANIKKIEKMAHSKGTKYSLIIAFIGTVFMAISVFAITGEKIRWFSAIVGGILGIIGWILPVIIYKRVKEKEEIINKTEIEKEYNTIYETCEKARKILIEE